MKSHALFGISLAKSGLYSLEGLMIPFAQAIVNRSAPRIPIFENPQLFLNARRALRELLWNDSQRIAKGIYPASVLVSPTFAEDARKHIFRLPGIFRDAMDFHRRKNAKVTKKFSGKASKLAKKAPDYYARNFHFQEDGYLSPKSAEIYDHQVELLFGGAADAMRRLAIAPIKEYFGDRKKLKILELGCGTGSATRFLAAAFPQAQITAVDLSEPYLEEAALRPECARVDFSRANAERLPFQAKDFDVVVSVFLFHELPLPVREKILKESRRVLKKSGLFVFVDSLQLGDVKELNEPLLNFPKEFHEPFYPNYVRHPMEELLVSAGFENRSKETGFFSKVCAVTVSANSNSR